jgi:signal transduction histidine kinase
VNSKRTRVAFAIAAGCLLVAMAFVERSSPDYKEDHDFTATLAAGEDLDQALPEHALEARFELAANYDRLARDDVELRRLDDAAKSRIPDFLRATERRRIEAGLARYTVVAAERQVILEHFNSQNALLKNSVAYFPTLAADVLSNARDPELAAAVIELRARTLTLALRNDPLAVDAQRKSVDEVLRVLRAMDHGAAWERTERLVAHARLIATAKARTDALLRELSDLPIDKVRADVTSLYEGYYEGATKRTKVFGSFVSALALLLLTLVAYTVIGMRRLAVELRRSNEGLELAVEERTFELKEAIAHRDRVEVELRQAQKLEAIGRLAAGIAHEINTPLQYVNDNVTFLEDGVVELLALVDELRAATREGAGPELVQKAREAEAAVDLAYLAENIPSAVAGALEGLSRVAAIVHSMKQFAHPDQREMQATDLNRALASTLVVCRGEYKLIADLETHFGDLPLVVCHQGEINQVILNIVVNAAHAMAKAAKTRPGKGRLVVRTFCESDEVVVTIRDNGCGIPKAIGEHIFEPFFTTKDVGEGTGQGLFMARSVIVDGHGGSLTFESEPGKGATFVIRLPVRGRALLAA